MHHPKSTYKQAVAYLFLGIYLCCTISFQLFEGVHFLLHLGDDTPVHSFQSHQSLHDHQILTAINDLVTGENSLEFPRETSKKIKIKKLVQISAVLITQKFISTDSLLSNYDLYNSRYKSPYPQNIAPPPQV